MELGSRFFELAEQLGYRKVREGKWVEELEDTNSGFPSITYHCPFCSATSDIPHNYCHICGADLRSKK